MNKGIIMLILTVVLAAMVLIMANKPGPQPEAAKPAFSSAASSAANTTRPAAVAEQSRPVQAPPALAPAVAAAENGTKASAPPVVPAPPPLPKLDPPASTPAETGGSKPAAPAAAGNGQDTAQKKGNTGFFSIPATPPDTGKRAGSTPPPPTLPKAQLDKKVAVPPKTDAQAQNGQKASAKPESKEPQSSQAPAAKGTRTATSVVLQFAGQGMVLRIEADAPFTAKAYVLPGPDRLVVDLAGDWKNLQAPKVPSNNLVKGARLGRQPEAMRLVLDLSRVPKNHQKVQVSDTVMEVRLQ